MSLWARRMGAIAAAAALIAPLAHGAQQWTKVSDDTLAAEHDFLPYQRYLVFRPQAQ